MNNSGLALLASLVLLGSVARAQDAAAGQKTYQAKCASCHGQNAEGKPAMKAPAVKGKGADDIQKQITTSPKHSAVKNLTPAEVKDLAAYLATLK
jgi:mono/diheme cytochrome c family protein